MPPSEGGPRRLLLTGASGFVGGYARAAFAAAGYEVVRAGRRDADVALDLREEAGVEAAVARVRPTHVLHLAAQSFVPAAAADPLGTYDVNAMGAARLARALARSSTPSRLLLVSSAEVYGYAALGPAPLTERDAPLPANPYAASKLAAETLAGALRGPSLELIVARPFNHIGPGQDARFAVAGFAAQLARIAAGAPPVVSVGNLEAERDVLDVRDVVAAYALLMERGVDGEVYNVASGRPTAVGELLRRLLALAPTPVEVRPDLARMRGSEIPRCVGDATKLRLATGWAPRTTLDASLAATLEAATAAARSPAAAG